MVTTLHKEGAKVAAHKACASSHQDAVAFNARLGLHRCGRVGAQLHGCLPCLHSIMLCGSWDKTGGASSKSPLFSSTNVLTSAKIHTPQIEAHRALQAICAGGFVHDWVQAGSI